jgi:hypothetical protein
MLGIWKARNYFNMLNRNKGKENLKERKVVW